MPNGGEDKFYREESNIYTYYRIDGSTAPAPKPHAHKMREGLFSWIKGFQIRDLAYLFIGLGLVRGLILGELLPFGGAFLAAVLVFRPQLAALLVLSLTTGLFSISLPEGIFWQQVAVFVLLAGVVSSAKRQPEQWWVLLPLFVLAGYLLVGNVFLLWTGWNLYQEIALIFEAVMAGFLCLIFMVALQWVETRRETVMQPEESIALIILGACFILGISDLHWQHWTIGPIAATLVVLIAAYGGGAGAGSAAGAIIGLLPSVTNLVMPYAIGVYAVAGLLGGLFRGWGRLGMGVGFLLGNLLLTLYLSGGNIGREILYPVSGGVLLFLLLPQIVFTRLGAHIPMYTFGFRRKLSFEQEIALKDPEVGVAGAGLKKGGRPAGLDPIWGRLVNEKLGHLTAIFTEVSATLEKNKACVTSTEPNFHADFLAHLEKGLCEECPAHHVCWEENFSVAHALEAEDLLLRLKNRCLYPQELVEQIKQALEKKAVDQYWQERVTEGQALVAQQVKGLTQVLEDLRVAACIPRPRNKSLEKRTGRELKRLGVNFVDLCVRQLPGGALEIYFYRQACRGKNDCQNRLLPGLSSLLGQRFKINPGACPGKDKAPCTINLFSAGRLTVELGMALRPEDGGICSGDNHLAMNLPGPRQVLALSDGMGRGPTAAANSGLALNLIKKILEVGLSIEQAVDALNSLLLLRSGEETFVTLDLVEINLQNGESEFIKMGAPPAFIKRGTEVRQLAYPSSPIGILHKVEIKGQKEQLISGDIIVLVTDGVLDSRYHVAEKEVWLIKALQQMDTHDPQAIADRVLNRALANSHQVKDDMAVLVAHIGEHSSSENISTL